MLRPVWSFPRHNEADTSETLQSDVMRFIAILALCLVAIFALVQSLPLHPVAKPSAAEPAVEAPAVEPVTTVQPSPAPEPEPVNDMPPAKTQPVPLPVLKKKLEKETQLDRHRSDLRHGPLRDDRSPGLERVGKRPTSACIHQMQHCVGR